VGSLLLASASLFLLQFEKVQTFAAKRFASYYAKQLGTQLSIDRIHIDLFGPSTLKGLYIEDQQGDTLLYASSAELKTRLLKWWKGPLEMDQISLQSASIHIQLKDSVWNHQFLVNYIQGQNPKKSGSQKRKQQSLTLHQLDLDQVRFRYTNHLRPQRSQGIDFDHLDLSEVTGQLKNIQFSDSTSSFEIQHFNFIEKSGFQLQQLQSEVIIRSQSLECKNLYLQTNKSKLKNYLRFNFDRWSDFRAFIPQVAMHLRLDDSKIDSRDIAYFTPELNPHQFEVKIEGLFSGRVDHFVGRQVRIETGSQTTLAGRMEWKGLPSIKNTQFDLQLSEFKTSYQDLERGFPGWIGQQGVTLPPIWQKIGSLQFGGQFVGTFQEMKIDGLFETGLGSLMTSAEFKRGNTPYYKGRFQATDLNLGELTGNPLLHQTSFDLVLEGEHFSFDKMKSTLNGQIHRFDFHQYRYQQIQIEGHLDEKWFSGVVEVNDPGLELNFEGDIFLDPTSAAFQFEADIHKANLHALQWYTRDTILLENARIRSNLKGPHVTALEGFLDIHDMVATINQQKYPIERLEIEAEGQGRQRQVALVSNLLDMNLKGQVEYTDLLPFGKAIVAEFVPTTTSLNSYTGEQDFELDLRIKNFNPFAQLWKPNLQIDSGAHLKAHFSSRTPLEKLSFTSPRVQLDGIQLFHAQITQDPNRVTSYQIDAKQLTVLDSYALKNIQFATEWQVGLPSKFYLKAVDSSLIALDLVGTMHLPENHTFSLQIDSSTLEVNDKTWHFLEGGQIDVAHEKIQLRQVGLRNQDQQIVLAGTLSKDVEDRLKGEFQDFDLSFFNPFIQHTGIQLSGSIHGQSTWNSVLHKPNAVADLRIDHIIMNGIEVGDMSIGAVYEPTQQLANVLLSIHRNQTQTFSARGTYNANADVDKLQLNARFDQMELAVFQPVLRHLVGEIKGQISADLRINGTIQNPKFNGTAQLQNAQFNVLYLNTPYTINDRIKLQNTAFVFEDLELQDAHQHTAKVNGSVDLKNILTPLIDVRIDATNFMVLNTTRQHNSLYYGTAFGTGLFEFKGPTNAISIQIKAKTNPNTHFTIPLNAMGMLNELDFIRFVGNEQKVERPTTRFAQGLHMRMDLQLTPDAETQIFTDLGELSGRGEGNIVLQISSLDDFEMFGNYAINSGKFTFTAQDYINKIFEINRGGSIRWTGRPTEASVKLTANYEQRTSLAPLYNAAGRPDNEQRVLAQALMNLDGQLLQPEISFGLNFPADPYVKDELQSYLSDINNVNQQALSLILRRSFSPGSTTDFSREINNTLLSAGTELAFNQLNNLIAQSLNLNFVDLNIKSLNDASASFRFFNDRLVFTGGVTDRRNQPLNDLNVFSNRVATDAELLYLIRRDGRLVLRGSNRLNARHFLLNPTDEYISAFGLIYRQEFNTFGEFFRRMLIIKPTETLKRTQASRVPIYTEQPL
jgi:autotransporter translocation and assembly factor TamB